MIVAMRRATTPRTRNALAHSITAKAEKIPAKRKTSIAGACRVHDVTLPSSRR